MKGAAGHRGTCACVCACVFVCACVCVCVAVCGRVCGRVCVHTLFVCLLDLRRWGVGQVAARRQDLSRIGASVDSAMQEAARVEAQHAKTTAQLELLRTESQVRRLGGGERSVRSPPSHHRLCLRPRLRACKSTFNCWLALFKRCAMWSTTTAPQLQRPTLPPRQPMQPRYRWEPLPLCGGVDA